MMSKIYPNTCESNGKLRSFTLDGRKIVVDEVIDHWQEGEDAYVKLLADDERIYFLKHAKGKQWEVEKVYSLQSLSQWG